MINPMAVSDGNRFYYGWIIVAVGFLTLFTTYGVQYSFGVFLPEIEASLAPGRRAIISLGFSLYAILYCLLSFVSGRMSDRWGPRRVLALGGVLLGGGLVLVSISTDLWHYFLAYGLLAALGMSSVFVPATSTIVKWFVRRRGLAVGIAVAGIGVGQLTIPLLSALLIGAWGWRTTFLTYGLFLAVIVPLLALVMQREPEARGLRPYGVREISSDTDDDPIEDKFLTPSQAMRTHAFWLYGAVLFLFWSVVFIPIVHLPAFAQDTLGISPERAAFTITALAVGATSGNFWGGTLSDLLGRKRAFVLVILAQSTGFLGLVLASLVENAAITFVSAAIFGLGYGSTGSIYPAYTGDLFGRRYAGSIAGLLFMAAAATGIGAFLAGVLFEATDGYTIAFALGAALTFSALPVLLLLKSPLAAPSRVEAPNETLTDAPT